jgi:DNA-binding response OmpR family regulator
VTRILVVEDEPGLQMTLVDRLESEGFQVASAREGFAAERRALEGDIGLIILDVMLPGQGGFEVCSRLRRQGIQTPILMLTALQEVDDRVQGLALGADDYLRKPFDMKELLARVHALLRRVPPRRQQIRVGSVEVDLAATRVTRDGEPVEMSARLFQLLAYLIDHQGETVSRDQLLNEVWGHKSTPSTRTVDVHIGWLRRIVEADPADPQCLITVHGIGYRLDLS